MKVILVIAWRHKGNRKRVEMSPWLFNILVDKVMNVLKDKAVWNGATFRDNEKLGW